MHNHSQVNIQYATYPPMEALQGLLQLHLIPVATRCLVVGKVSSLLIFFNWRSWLTGDVSLRRCVVVGAGRGRLCQVRFEDGTVERFDAVIGADGIFSLVRSFVLSDAAAAAAAAEHGPSLAGFWDCRVLVPFDKAKATLGEQYFDVHRQYGWVGDGAFIMHDILDAGTTVQSWTPPTRHPRGRAPAQDRPLKTR